MAAATARGRGTHPVRRAAQQGTYDARTPFGEYRGLRLAQQRVGRAAFLALVALLPATGAFSFLRSGVDFRRRFDHAVPGMKSCKICFGPLTLLGVLGNITHTRCVDCGAVFSTTKRVRRIRKVTTK